ncbi:MAG: sugar phosphate isomerase/epimerase [Deltaproteobacteria bacterium]|nr:sugar phosphate isomerase/epimerase [Deltaproteobacteria bacterium]
MEKFPFVIGTTSMIFGADLLANVRRLAASVQVIEIVLFKTPDLHNLPSPSEIAELKRIGAGENLRFSVHLPASLEPASADRQTRKAALADGPEICRRFAALDPEHFILHLPFSKPTLVPIPDFYFHEKQPRSDWDAWTARAAEALEQFQKTLAGPERLLVENINYSPCFLTPFLEADLCRLCLDIGHLLLGREPVAAHLEQFRAWIREIHLHGVVGYNEHISLRHLPEQRLGKWLQVLEGQDYRGWINLELFDPQDLQESLQLLRDRFGSG